MHDDGYLNLDKVGVPSRFAEWTLRVCLVLWFVFIVAVPVAIALATYYVALTH